ncbi:MULTISPECIES: succinate dehydrogenase, hydrophobic membrane anchor protein [Limibacillus]|jgi:succinate dehydrogenase / fumarate reductase membrane anchor subunit|uniref:Succinate dehydrogenase hydrophobic membrane anchor subunit n=1 Tax=Limibacillus halophilus TaxID=1579333 RepID=A0A839SS11_9PROT|nr:succinate dehydrogenase, hydrophobic membrane anchor protein [Limibacillus halophilus]MBB3063805.1 succinate dehydrogenase / fumarate reductase membrane anchor subunit [Limibacillus halophilus]
MSLRTPLARVRGLGSAKDGTGHWWSQRLTAIALVPLCLWFVVSVISMVGADYGTFLHWLSSPLSGGLMILLIIATFYHAALGLQVVIEDYVHQEGIKIASIIAVKFACIVLGLAATLSVLKIMV